MEAKDIKLGDIVSLNTHPFFENQTSIIITGDHQSIPPLMIVTEILHNAKNQYDEVTREELVNKDYAECKCLWFSSKTTQFEEAWISSKILKLIKPAPKVDKPDIIPSNKLVVFRTLHLELGKQKSTISTENISGNNKTSTNITALLSFVSPVMQVISVRANDEKTPKFDVKTGNQKRFVTSHLVKCKWYNHSNDKMSEKVLPLEALEIIPNIDRRTLDKYANGIKIKQHYITEADGVQTIFVPMKLTNRSGFYFLNGYDYILNQMNEVQVKYDLKTLNNPFLRVWPEFNDRELFNNPVDELIEILNNPDYKENYIKITYKNQNDIVRTRTIKQFEVIPNNKGEDTFLRGYCYFRQEERTFRIERIQRLQVLDLKYKKGTPVVEEL